MFLTAFVLTLVLGYPWPSPSKLPQIIESCLYSKFHLFADDLKMYQELKSVEDCKCLQADIDSV
jgi:hypothetical protein